MGGALSSITGREGVEAAGYVYAGQFLAQTPKYVRGGAAAIGTGYAYDYYKSQASSASSYQQHGGVGGTLSRFKGEYGTLGDLPAGTRMKQPLWKVLSRHPYGGTKTGRHQCGKGWTLVKVGGAATCVRFPRKRVRNKNFK